MASQLARGFLAEQDLERFVREEHGGNRAAAARAQGGQRRGLHAQRAQGGPEVLPGRPGPWRRRRPRGCRPRLCAAACREIGHFNRCVGHATRALAVDANDLESLRDTASPRRALGAWRHERGRLRDSATRMRPRARRRRAAISPWSSTRRPKATRAVQAALDEASLGDDVARKSVRKPPVEQASRRWRGGRHDDSARTRRKILISTRAYAARRAVRGGAASDEALVIESVLWKCASLNLRRARRGGAARDLLHKSKWW